MTATAEKIVTALSEGPCTARGLSQRLDGIGYANIRQTLRRLAEAGIVTKHRRGLYGIGCDLGCDTAGCDSHGTSTDCDSAPRQAVPRHVDRLSEQRWAAALASVWADFEAQNDPLDERAWA